MFHSITCEHCGSRQMQHVGPNESELKCSACAKMIQLASKQEEPKKEEAPAAPKEEPKQEEKKEEASVSKSKKSRAKKS